MGRLRASSDRDKEDDRDREENAYKNVWVAFQPHTYSRTEAFLENFAEALKLADKVMITDVYAAREKYNGRVHACDLAALIPGSVYMNDMKAMERYIRQNAQPAIWSSQWAREA